MNRTFIYLTLISFLLLKIDVVSGQNSSTPQYLKKALLNDVNYMLQSFEDIQVNCFLHISKEDLFAKRDSIFNALPDNISIKEAFLTINRIAAFLKDTHTYVDNYDYIFTQYKQSAVFPIKISIDTNSNVFVDQKFIPVGKLTKGNLLIDINGFPVEELFQKSIDMQGGLLDYQINEAINFFSYNLYLLNITAPYIVSYKSTSSEILYDTIPGIMFAEYEKANQIKHTPKYSYALLKKDVGYIDFRSMSGGLNQFRKFLDSCFTSLKSINAKGLIVDLRYNGGGNSEYGELLLSYLSDKSYRLSSGRHFKVSQQYQGFMKENYPDQSSKDVVNYLKAKPGTILSFKYKKKKYLTNNPQRYSLKTCFLIGPQNLSSATMLADGAQTYKIATLIGQPTGAPANDGGESYNFKLPYSNFDVSTSSTFDIRANGNKNDNNPVLPDIFIKEQKSMGEDSVLDYALSWIYR